MAREGRGGRPLLAVEDAVERVLALTRPLPPEPVGLDDALERVLAADVASDDEVPPFDNSAMDGFAVRAGDTRAARPEAPQTLRLVGESRAGRPAPVPVAEGQAVRISTGAALPEGANAVVRLEDASEAAGGWIAVEAEVEAGREIRRAGEDIARGEVVLSRGTTLGPAELGVLASVGAAEAVCSRRPRVSVVTTGDELVEPGRPLAPGEIRNTNARSLPAQVRRAGAAVVTIGHARDSLEATRAAVRDSLDGDLLVVCGGVSVGEHDHVKNAFTELGIEEVFWGLALRPGRPTWFGIHRSPEGDQPTLVFGLPGNPVSAMVTFHLLVRPALRSLLGASPEPRRATAVMDEGYAKRPGRAHAVRCRLETRGDGWHVRPTKAQGSHVLTSMLGAGALALLDADRGDVAEGERVEIELLD